MEVTTLTAGLHDECLVRSQLSPALSKTGTTVLSYHIGVQIKTEIDREIHLCSKIRKEKAEIVHQKNKHLIF